MSSAEEFLKGKHVLMVDDHASNIFALGSYLDMIGMHIHTAENGFEAITYLREQQPVDLVLMDMMMPEMDGFEAIAKIRKDKTIAPVPIIAVTAQAMKGDREKCLQAGANDYVSKPVDLTVLMQKMMGLLKL